jgi:hypothetical protein
MSTGGLVRGITRDGTLVAAHAKVVDIDPHALGAFASGIGERPSRSAEGVLRAIRESPTHAPVAPG